MTDHEYFALMAEYLAQLEQKVRNQGSKMNGIHCSLIFSWPEDELEDRLIRERMKLDWAERQVNAIFDIKETDHEKPA